MKTAVLKLGDDLGIAFPKDIAEILGVSEYDKIEFVKEKNKITIKKAKLTLESLFEGYDGDYKPEEYDFGEDVGRERVWSDPDTYQV
ncbi:MAG: AbrB/MazE/SpoVT family DNA-binding domain-containing protein [Defluviitaleaceae bacterium]|nr:AbrB/MazE/SpoVT family DNA-binding domain-containing protein [Defluviitaleaceae bacterium]